MISKELLSEVLELEDDIISIELKGNIVIWVAGVPFETTMIPSCTGAINIYELAFKCKEWALNKQYSLHSGYDKLVNKYDVYVNLLLFGDDESTIGGWDTKIYFIADTEPGAIFKACQWLLDNKEINK